ncbi:MAG TPA: SDR family oxidoreductase [Rhodanobacteraceae bacterium]|nr:SDR family oxidoreductase [Rhodanobacteraceae bacterium]
MSQVMHALPGPRRREVVVITGASAGVGRATVRAFTRQGAHIALLARGQRGLDAACREVELGGGKCLPIAVDTSDSEAMFEAADRIERELGPIDIWINNAMVTMLAPFKAIAPEEFKRVTDVTYLGVVYGTMAALRYMLPRNRGRIVQVASALSRRSIPLQSPYCGAKHAILGFTASLRSELIHDGSRVGINTVHLPAVNTPQFGWARNRMPKKPQPVPPIYQPEVAAQAIYWSAHHDRRALLVGAPTLLTEWAQKLAPRLLDRYLGRTGYAAQQGSELDDPQRPDNLFEPVDTEPGARGRFNAKAHAHSPELWAAEHRGWVFGASLLAAGALLCAARLYSHRHARRTA